MNFVEPIRDRKKIAQIKNLLRGEKRFRTWGYHARMNGVDLALMLKSASILISSAI
jgi:hypothetical protein